MGVREPIGDVQPFVELARRPDTVVYKAYQHALERFVLLKVMRPDRNGSGERAKRFSQEARLVARIQHPNVVSVYDYGECDGESYIISEFVEGCDLATLLDSGKLPVEIVLYVVRMIAQGLAAAHQNGVLHRDIKPANVLVSAEGDVKIADFGMASLQSDAADVRGTLAYLSPEQLRGSAADERSDLFSLGATLFEMLAGRRAFQASGRSATIDSILNFDPIPLIDADQRVPSSMRDLCAMLLDKDPDRRPSSAVGLLAQVAKIEHTTPPASREQVVAFLQDPSGYRPPIVSAPAPELRASSSSSRTWQRPTLFAATFVVALLVVAGVLTWNKEGPPTSGPEPARATTFTTEERTTARIEEADTGPDESQTHEAQVAPIAPSASSEVDERPRLAIENAEEVDVPVPLPQQIVEPLAPANLHIISDPWAAVFVNDDSLGTTPMETLTLAPGRYDVVLRNPFFPPYERTIQLEPGAGDTLAVSLWATVAQLSVHATPWAVVYLNGEEAGTVPLHERPFFLAPGRHVLRLENKALGVAREMTLNVRAGEARTVEVDLTTERP